jgi:hypothetical protein
MGVGVYARDAQGISSSFVLPPQFVTTSSMVLRLTLIERVMAILSWTFLALSPCLECSSMSNRSSLDVLRHGSFSCSAWRVEFYAPSVGVSLYRSQGSRWNGGELFLGHIVVDVAGLDRGGRCCLCCGRVLGSLLQKDVKSDVEIDDTTSKQPVFMVFPLCCMPWTIP